MAKKLRLDPVLDAQLAQEKHAQEVRFDKMHAYYESIADKHGLHDSEWSYYRRDYRGVNMMANHPYARVTKLIYASDEFFGDPHGLFEMPIKGKRWLDIWIAANAILKRCGDKHHRFIEVFRNHGNGTLEMFCGS